MLCPQCGRMNPESLENCPRCGEPIYPGRGRGGPRPDRRAWYRQPWVVVLSTLALLALAGALMQQLSR